MALTLLPPREGAPKASNGPAGKTKLRGKTPSQAGHRVAGKGSKGASKGTMGGVTTRSGGNKTGGHGTTNSRGGLSIGSSSSDPKTRQQNTQRGIYK